MGKMLIFFNGFRVSMRKIIGVISVKTIVNTARNMIITAISISIISRFVIA